LVFESRKIKILKLSNVVKKSNDKIRFIRNKILLKIENIDKSLYTGTVYNFECDTHTYMCRNILTHNCDPCARESAGLKSSKNGEHLEQKTPC